MRFQADPSWKCVKHPVDPPQSYFEYHCHRLQAAPRRQVVLCTLRDYYDSYIINFVKYKLKMKITQSFHTAKAVLFQ